MSVALAKGLRGGARERICFIHAGTHKTGTTSLQAFLRDNTERFAACGVLVPRAGRGIDAAGHHNLAQQLLAGAGYRPERGGLAEVAAELRRAEYSRVCLSSEDFVLASRSPAALRQLRDAIVDAGYAPVVVLYLRPQISYCISIYAELVKNGYRQPFATYLAEIEQHGSFVWNGSLGPICRYDVLLERFADVFGARGVVVRRYHSSAPPDKLLRSFARLIGATTPDFQGFHFPPERYNPTLSFPRVLRELRHDESLVDMRFAPLDIRQLFDLAKHFWRGNLRVARRFGVWIPPFELRDLLMASPIRRTRSRAADLARARRALNIPAAARPEER